MAFVPKVEEEGKPVEEAGKTKARRSAIPFLGASKVPTQKTPNFVPFTAGSKTKSNADGGQTDTKKFMSVLVPTIDQVKKGCLSPQSLNEVSKGKGCSDH